MSRRFFTPAVLVCLLAACSDGGGPPAATLAGVDPTVPGGLVPVVTAPAPVEGTLAIPASAAELLQPDPTTALAALGFPEGWVLPADPTDIIGLTVRLSQGDDLYTTFSATYTVPGSDPAAVLTEWSENLTISMQIDLAVGEVHASSELGEAWSRSSLGDAEVGQPSIDIELARLEGSDTFVVTLEYQTLDRTFPEVEYPTLDPTEPSFAGCEVRRIDIDLDPSVDVTSPAEPPVYRLWREGSCSESAFDEALAWATGHGFEAGSGTTGFGHTATLADGTTVEVNAHKGDDGKVFLSVVSEEPIA